MHGDLVVLAVLVGAGAFLLLADRTQIPYPILLTVGGTALAFLPPPPRSPFARTLRVGW